MQPVNVMIVKLKLRERLMEADQLTLVLEINRN